jgi:hypothetical protein
MGNALKSKLNSNVVTAIDDAVQHALDEKLHDAEEEIVEKVIYRLDHKRSPVAMQEHRGMFNPLGGP